MHERGAGLRPNCGRNGSILEEMNGAMHSPTRVEGGDPCFQRKVTNGTHFTLPSSVLN